MQRLNDKYSPPGKFIDIDGIKIHVEISGQGAPEVLFIHGYLGSTYVWKPLFAHWKDGPCIAAIDLPGAGYSDRPAGAPYDLPWFADLLAGMIKRLGAESLYLCGHSLGGAVALHCAARHPELVKGLILVSPLVYSPAPPPGLRLAKKYPKTAQSFFSSLIGRTLVESLIRRAAFAAPEMETKQRAALLLKHLDAPGGWEAAMKTGVLAAAHAPESTMLSRIRKHTLLFWGERDRVHPFDLAKKLAVDLPEKPKTILFSGAGHNCHEECAGLFAVELSNWLKKEREAGVRRDSLPQATHFCPSAS
jgi:pimeloyl-ACP methyl ester carboxylesterase